MGYGAYGNASKNGTLAKCLTRKMGFTELVIESGDRMPERWVSFRMGKQ